MSVLASRLGKIQPSPTLLISSEAAKRKAAGIDVIGLGAGELDAGTPENIKNAAFIAMQKEQTKYTAVDGTAALKEAIINKFKRDNNLNYDPSEITVGCGGKHTLFNAIYATVNDGDEVIIPTPYWVSYIDIVMIADGKPVVVKTDASNGFKLTADSLRAAITNKTKWVILNSPSNPSGSAYTYEELRSIANVLLQHPNVYVLTDDIYEHILYDNKKFFNILMVEPLLKDRTFVLNGVSKAYSMTGWRIGYGAGPKDIIKAISMIQSQSTSNPCSISQAASVEALNGPQDFIHSNNKILVQRRDMIVLSLNSIDGVKCAVPDGAFYVFPSIENLIGKQTKAGRLIQNCTDFANYLLDDALVAVVPGVAFGMENYVRISYATSDAALLEASNRIASACSDLR